ncbi:MAG: hypothetical protein ACRCWR_10875, partial [Saezia sp.]
SVCACTLTAPIMPIPTIKASRACLSFFLIVFPPHFLRDSFLMFSNIGFCLLSSPLVFLFPSLSIDFSLKINGKTWRNAIPLCLE